MTLLTPMLIALLACQGSDPEETELDTDEPSDSGTPDATDPNDADGDGFSPADGDCDDSNPTVFPGASEVWDDDIDHDCDGWAGREASSCEADITVNFPDGSSFTFDSCAWWRLDTEFEYDPDAPPKVTAVALELNHTLQEGSDCRILIRADNVCGEGYYRAPHATLAANLWATDCPGIPDGVEQLDRWHGHTRLNTLDGGSTTGSFAGLPLQTTITGALVPDPEIDPEIFVTAQGTFSVTTGQVAGDSEEVNVCATVPSDVDGDGQKSWRLEGQDCDDDNAAVYTGSGANEPDRCGSDVDEDGWASDVPSSNAPNAGGTDCDDSRDHVYPGATLDAEPDECMLDSDGDGWGANTESIYPTVTVGLDCNDTRSDVSLIDTDRDGEVDFCGYRPAIGDGFACAVNGNGAITCWGAVTDIASNAPSGTFVDIVAGSAYACALADSGSVTCWGSSTTGVVTPPTGTYVDLTGGFDFACALDEAGEVTCWGSNAQGQHGAPAGPFTSIESSIGALHTCALRPSGEAACWGYPGPHLTPSAGPFVDLGTARQASCGVKTDGSLACWGIVGAISSLLTTPSLASVACSNQGCCVVDDTGWMRCLGGGTGNVITDEVDYVILGDNGGLMLRGDGLLTRFGAASEPPEQLRP